MCICPAVFNIKYSIQEEKNIVSIYKYAVITAIYILFVTALAMPFKGEKGLNAGFHFGKIRSRDQAIGYLGMRSSKSKLKASVYWRTRGQFRKLNQVQLFRDQNERQPIRKLLFNARACDRTGSRDRLCRSGNQP